MEVQPIPEKYIDFVKEIGKLAARYDVSALSGSFNPPVFDNWWGNIEFSWDSGRHGADKGRIHLKTTHHTNLEFKWRDNAESQGGQSQ